MEDGDKALIAIRRLWSPLLTLIGQHVAKSRLIPTSTLGVLVCPQEAVVGPLVAHNVSPGAGDGQAPELAALGGRCRALWRSGTTGAGARGAPGPA